MKFSGIYKFGILIGIMMSLSQVSCARRMANVYPLDKSYYREARLVKELNSLAKNNAGFVKLHKIGITDEGKNPIYALQIQTDIEREPILIIGQHHGDEVLGVEIAMALAKKLVQDSTEAKVRDVLAKYSFWIIPTLNPDAWEIVTSGKYQWKRKNNTDTNNNHKLDLKTDGVDLNRNYPLYWERDKIQPESSPYYKGIAPGSENEIKAMIELTSMINFRYAFSYHSSVSGSYAEKIYLPWQDYSDDSLLPDFRNMRKVADYYASSIERDYSAGTYSVHPGNTSRIGNARNYLYYENGAYAYDIETGGYNKLGIGIIHPRADMREKIVKKNVDALLTTLLLASED